MNELRELYHDDRSLSIRYKNRFGGKYPPFHFYEERVKIIGGSLNKIGGENLMREAYIEFKKHVPYDFMLLEI